MRADLCLVLSDVLTFTGDPCAVEYCSSGSCRRRYADDGTVCTLDGGTGVCVYGECGENLCEGVSCDDEPCREGICDFTDGLCDYIAQSADGTPCVDGDGLDGVYFVGVCQPSQPSAIEVQRLAPGDGAEDVCGRNETGSKTGMAHVFELEQNTPPSATVDEELQP